AACEFWLGDLEASAREFNRACRGWIACGEENSIRYTHTYIKTFPIFLALDDKVRATACMNEVRKVITRVSKDFPGSSCNLLFMECCLLYHFGQHQELLAQANELIEHSASLFKTRSCDF